MGRGRVQLKRIENKINRQVTFSKRRVGLLKKAHEISVLCDAEVAAIVFSAKGKLYEYATDSSMARILERYERHTFSQREPSMTSMESEGPWSLQFGKLKARFEHLQKSHRHYLGEDLDSLNMKELQHLEHQLDSSLRRVRSRKNQILCDTISDLHMKEKSIQEQNNILEKKIQEKEREKARQSQGEVQSGHGNQNQPPASLFPIPLPTLSIGTYSKEDDKDNEVEGPCPLAQKNCLIPPWMLRHADEQ